MIKLLRILLVVTCLSAVATTSVAEAAPTQVAASPKKSKGKKSAKSSKAKKGKVDSPADDSSAKKASKPKKRTPVVRGQQVLQLKAKKDNESKLYGYENVGDKYYWWAEAHKMGDDKKQLNLGLETQWVISPQYTRVAKEFSEGLAAVELNGKVGFIDRLNHFIIPPEFEPMNDMDGFHYGLAAAKKNGKYGFIDKNGQWVIPPIYDDAENFGKDYLAVVKRGNRFGCIDLTGDSVVPCSYMAKEIMKTIPGKNKAYREAKKRAKERWEQGYYDEWMTEIKRASDEAGLIINNPNYTEVPGDYKPDNATNAGDGFFIINNGENKVGATDTYGRNIISTNNSNVVYDPTQRLFLVERSITTPEKYTYHGVGINNTAGGCIIPPVFDSVGPFDSEGYATATVGSLSGKVNVVGMVDDPFLQNLLAESIKENGVQYTRHLIGILPTCAPAHNCLGIYYASECDNLADAIHHFTVAHRLEPDNEDYKNNMKAAKSTRNSRRWNRVLTGMQIAGTIISLGAITYSAATGTPMSTTDFSATTGGTSSFSSGYDDPDGMSSPSSSSSSSGGMDAATYKDMYSRWERQAKSNYEALTRGGTRTSTDGKATSGTADGYWKSKYVGLKKLLRDAQKNMRKIRQEARRYGITIPESNYETVTVTN